MSRTGATNIEPVDEILNNIKMIQMKATEQYFPVVLFIVLYKVVLTFETVDEILKRDHSNERYCNEQYIPVALFVMM